MLALARHTLASRHQSLLVPPSRTACANASSVRSRKSAPALRFWDEVGVVVTSEALKTFLRQGGHPDELIQWEGVCWVKSTLRG